MAEAISNGVKVQVKSEFLPEQSNPKQNYFLFAYHITITNMTDETIQLLSRRWVITNADGKQEEVEGPGVVGEQPVLEPEEIFEYSSFCPLTTSVGTMQGSFQMIDENREPFDVEVPLFTLATESVMVH